MDLSSQRINDVHQFYSVKHSSAQHKGRYIIRPQFLTSIGEQRRLGFCPRLSLRMVSRNLCICRKKGGSRMFRDHIPAFTLSIIVWKASNLHLLRYSPSSGPFPENVRGRMWVFCRSHIFDRQAVRSLPYFYLSFCGLRSFRYLCR